MKVELKTNKITLSEVPVNDVPGALIVLDKKLKSTFIDVTKDKQTYRLPNGMTIKDIASVYLRIL
jgi:hypothetical protein